MSPGKAASRGAGAAPPASPVAGPPLAGAPRIDLVANRYLWHIARDGLVVPFAAEGLRKYSQEYSQPWGNLVEQDGRTGRMLRARSATLTVPWRGDGAATARLWVHGLIAGQKIELHVNGRRAGIGSAGASWSQLVVPIAAGALREGENRLRLIVARPGRAGGGKSYGLFEALELVPGQVGPAAQPPPASPVSRASHGGVDKEALVGPRMFLYVEIPESAWLRVDTAGPAGARLRARVRTVDGKVSDLIDTAGSEEWTAHQVSLADHADSLVELELSAEGGGAWGEPLIALERATVAPPPPTYDNVVLVVVDALRSDRLALHGKTRVRTPRITAEGERGVVFANNQAASPSSPPSHGSIQTGMIPRVHGVSGDKAQLSPGTPMLSTQLGAAGVATGYYGNNPFGMARLKAPGKWTAFHQPSQEGKGIDCTALVPEIIGFARAQRAAGKRFFVSTLPYEPHTPYRFHAGISDRFHRGPWGPPVGKSVDGGLLSGLSSGKVKLTDAQWDQLRALYDGEVEYFDGCFAALLDGLAELGVADSTAVVLTSDHGEGMFEHGRMGHAFGHYAELANVPLVLMARGLVTAGRKIETVTSHLDIAPTVLALMGVEPDERVQGESLIPLVRRDGPWTPRVMPLEYGRSFALRSRRYKLIVDYGGTESVFDLERDPREQDALSGRDSMVHRYLHDLAGFFLAHRTRWRMARWGSLNNHSPRFAQDMDEGPPRGP